MNDCREPAQLSDWLRIWTLAKGYSWGTPGRASGSLYSQVEHHHGMTCQPAVAGMRLAKVSMEHMPVTEPCVMHTQYANEGGSS